MTKKNLPSIESPQFLTQAHETFDVDAELQDSNVLFIVLFGQSTSSAYPLAVYLAEKSKKYGIATFKNKKTHIAVMYKTPEDIARAIPLLAAVAGWKSTLVYTRDSNISHPFLMIQSMECYLRSLKEKDIKGHCHSEFHDARTGHRFLIPCYHLRNRFYLNAIRGIGIEYDSETLKKELERLAIQEGCHWCPNFKLDDFSGKCPSL